jgi:hypothetical protein
MSIPIPFGLQLCPWRWELNSHSSNFSLNYPYVREFEHEPNTGRSDLIDAPLETCRSANIAPNVDGAFRSNEHWHLRCV